MGLKKADIMVVSPHPDDAEFGIAGTVANWVRAGKVVIYVVCTSGDKGTSDITMKSEDLARMREEEQRNAAQVLGVSEVIYLRFPDQGVEDTPQFRKELVRLIRMYRPDLVATTDPYRKYIWHRDHRITGQVTLDAVFPYARDHLAYPDLLAEGLNPYKVQEMWLWGTEDVNHRVDITDTFDIKIAALACHKSQVIGNISEEMRGRLLERARTMAEGESFELAEAFHRVQVPW
jgi:LmbE family N-acetylglucosaminyl deacetylase